MPAQCVALRVRCPGPLGSCSLVCPLCLLCGACGVLGHLAPVHQCARLVCCVACAFSRATWLLFTAVPARCVVFPVRCPVPLGSCSPVCPLGALLRAVRCPGPFGSCSPMCPLGALLCVCGVLGHLAPFHRCARVLCCVACAVFWASWPPFTGVPALCVVLRVRCPGPLGSCTPVCALRPLLCLCSVLGHLAAVHRCARSVCCVASEVSWATRLLFTGVRAPSFALLVRCPGPLGCCSPVCRLGVLCCVCSVLGHLAPVHRCACLMRCFVSAVSLANWLLFTGVPARCVVLGVAVSWATWLLYTGVRAPSFALPVQCPRPLGCCSPVCPLGVLCCFCGVLGNSAPVHRCARSVLCFACAVPWATWLLFTGVPARCVVLRVQCPGPLGPCTPVCLLDALLCECCVPGQLAPVHRCAGSVCCVGCCGVLGNSAPVHRCARSVLCFACAVPWATWLLFTGVPARCVVLRVQCPGPLGPCSPVCLLDALLCECCVPGQLAPVHRCAGSVCCVGCCGVLGHLAPVHRCARSVCCAVCCGCGVVCAGRRCGGHTQSIRTAAVRSRQGLGTVRARTRPSGQLLFVAGRGWVPSGRALVHPDGGFFGASRGWVR